MKMLLSEVEELAAKYGMESCGYDFLDGCRIHGQKNQETDTFC